MAIETPVEKLRAMGEAAYQRAQDRHSLSVQAEMLGGLIEESIVRSGRNSISAEHHETREHPI